MRTDDFDFFLPPELIAQTPLERRDASRLLTLSRETGEIAHRHFSDLPALIRPGDCLVVNNSRVLPARLFGQTPNGGVVETLLLRDLGGGLWECLVKPGKKARPGAALSYGAGLLAGTVEGEGAEGTRHIRFAHDGIFLELLERLGQMPLPPYIKERLSDPERYQTVYAREPGSAAAPTAGLHFTPELLERVRARGAAVTEVTLHVGLGTFRPVKENSITDHKMHGEYAFIPAQAAGVINKTRSAGGRILAVGTTVCRTLESFAAPDGTLSEAGGMTDIFITPGYAFRAIDGLITNFHLPRSTLLMLVSAFAGREAVLTAYREAVEQKYRFFSFGDAMLIL